MNFDDTPQEAEFRAIARKWIEANRPDDLMRDLAAAEEIRDRDQRTAALLRAAKAWQKKKADAGFACLTWPKDYGGRSATPIVPVNAFWHDASIPLPAYDIDKAKAILKAAGYSWGSDGALRAPAK